MAKRKCPTNSTPTRKRSVVDWGPKFLRRLALCGNIGEAARHAKIHRSTVYFRRDNDPVFAPLLAAALEDADDRLEGEARKRALRKSDKLLAFLLQVRRYKKSSTVEHYHTGAVTANVTHDLAERLAPYEHVLRTFLGAGGAFRQDSPVQPLDTAQAHA